MHALLDRLDGAWRLGVLTYGLRVLELCANGVHSVTGTRRRQLAPLDSAWTDGRGRTAIVTGANAGIGKALAGRLHRDGVPAANRLALPISGAQPDQAAHAGWRVVLACRSLERGKQAALVRATPSVLLLEAWRG